MKYHNYYWNNYYFNFYEKNKFCDNIYKKIIKTNFYIYNKLNDFEYIMIIFGDN